MSGLIFEERFFPSTLSAGPHFPFNFFSSIFFLCFRLSRSIQSDETFNFRFQTRAAPARWSAQGATRPPRRTHRAEAARRRTPRRGQRRGRREKKSGRRRPPPRGSSASNTLLLPPLLLESAPLPGALLAGATPSPRTRLSRPCCGRGTRATRRCRRSRRRRRPRHR